MASIDLNALLMVAAAKDAAAADVVYYHGNNYREDNVIDLSYKTQVEFKAKRKVTLVNDTRSNDDRSDACSYGSLTTHTGTYKKTSEKLYEAVFTKCNGNSCGKWSASFAVSGGVCVINSDKKMQYMKLDNKTVSVQEA